MIAQALIALQLNASVLHGCSLASVKELAVGGILDAESQSLTVRPKNESCIAVQRTLTCRHEGGYLGFVPHENLHLDEQAV